MKRRRTGVRKTASASSVFADTGVGAADQLRSSCGRSSNYALISAQPAAHDVADPKRTLVSETIVREQTFFPPSHEAESVQLLEMLLPLSSGTGRLVARLDLGGTLKHPDLSGPIRIENGEATVDSLGIRLRGINVDMALFDSIVAFNANQILNFWVSGNIPKRWGNAHVNITPYEVFPSADGFIILAVGNDSQFASFCTAARRPELATDPRFKTNPDRLKHRDALIPIVKGLIRERPSKQWIRDLEAANVPCGAINNMQEVFEDRHVQERGMRVDIPHPLSGTVPSVASPMRFSETPVTYDRPPPLLGQHTDEILCDLLGLDKDEIARLRDARVV